MVEFSTQRIYPHISLMELQYRFDIASWFPIPFRRWERDLEEIYFVFGEKAYLYMTPDIAAEYIERSKILTEGLMSHTLKGKRLDRLRRLAFSCYTTSTSTTDWSPQLKKEKIATLVRDLKQMIAPAERSLPNANKTRISNFSYLEPQDERLSPPSPHQWQLEIHSVNEGFTTLKKAKHFAHQGILGTQPEKRIR